MCEICSESTREDALKYHLSIAEKLHNLADFYESVGRGRIKPHTPEFRNRFVGAGPRSVAVELVENL